MIFRDRNPLVSPFHPAYSIVVFAAGWLLGILLALQLAFWPPPEWLLLALPLQYRLLRLRHHFIAASLMGFCWLLVFMAWRMELAPNRLDTQASLQIAEAYAEGHRSFLIFRRHLRQLAYEYPEVRQARADSRKRHVARIRQWQPRLRASEEEIASILLQLERLCDAIAESEFADMDLSDQGALHMAAHLIDRLRTEH